jgi:hypothetical protein
MKTTYPTSAPYRGLFDRISIGCGTWLDAHRQQLTPAPGIVAHIDHEVLWRVIYAQDCTHTRDTANQAA